MVSALAELLVDNNTSVATAADDDDIVSRLYYSGCELSSVNSGCVLTCDMSAVNCHPLALRMSFICVSSLVVSHQHQRLYWSDIGRGLIASAPLNDSDTVRSLRSALTSLIS